MPKVINIKTSREKRTYFINIFSSSVFRNPFSIQKFGRTECVEMYRAWVFNILKKDRKTKKDLQFIQELSNIRQETLLGCYCKPNECHGDVLVEAWNYLKQTRK